MAKQIARLLKADIQESSDLKSIAKMLSKKGRGGDTMLAHITPKEAKILKEAGGAGTVNPDTGLLEFYDGSFNIGSYGYDFGSDYADYVRPTKTYTAEMPTQQPVFDVTQYQAPGGYQAPAAKEPAAGYFDESAFYGLGDQAPYSVETPAAPIDYSKFGYIPFAGAPTAPSAEAPIQQFGVPPVAAPAAAGGAIAQAPAAAAEGAVTPIQPGLSDQLGKILSAVKEGGGDVLDFLKKNPELVKLASAGVGAVSSAQKIRQAGKQIQQATQEQKQVAQPYTKAGQEMQRAALAGELTPQSAQAYQALRAQMAQGIESRGGVGVAQAQAQLESFRQNLLQNQYNYGLQVAQIGDQIALGAIRTGMQLDQNLQQLAQQYTTNLLAIAGGVPPTAGATTARTQP